MKWYKHMTDMSQDVRVKRLIRAHGIQGYGLYNYILELIVRRLDNDSPMPDLEESSKDIAGDMGMDTLKVEEIMWFCIEQGLLSQDEMTGRLVAHKVYKFLQQSETRSKEIRNMIAVYKKGDNIDEKERPRPSETNVKNRIEENRIEEKREAPFRISHEGESLPANETRYHNLVDQWGESAVRSYLTKIILYSDSHGKRYKDYAATVAQWIQRDIDAGKGPRKAHKVANLDDLQSLG